MVKKNVLNKKGKNNRKTVLFTALSVCLAAGISGCGTSGIGEGGQATPNEAAGPVVEIKADNEPQTQLIAQMDLEAGVLPTLSGVTTAADNADLAPANLVKGVQNALVQKLQERLMSLGYMDNDEPTTYYGDATAAAVMHFQRRIGVTQDGICGPETWDALFSQSAPYYKVSKGDSGDDVARIQQRLYELGYLANNSGSGNFDDATEAAVKKMQQINGLTVDGEVGKESINLLYSDEIKANVIAFGEQSDIVMKAQQRLRDLGYLRTEPNGKFDSETQNAVREFQARNDQVVDGYLGPGTRAVLESADAKPFALQLGDSSANVLKAQKRLQHYNYLTSKQVTGYFDGPTEDAVKLFQRTNGLSPDGTVGNQTMTKLESDNAKKKPAASSKNNNKNNGSSGNKGTSGNHGSSSGGSKGNVGSGGATVSGSAGALISEASKHLGKPYVWGAKGPNAFDCSGFVYYCLRKVGVNQSYLTSSGWRNPGRYQRVSNFGSIQAGDIVVVRGHVGIAAGGGTVIDASSSNGRVVHRSLSGWWQNNFIVAWRIFG